METYINSNATVWTDSVTILPIDNNRRYSAFCNDSSNIIYISIWADAVVWKWIRLNANWWTFEINFQNPLKHSVHAIASWAGSNLSYITIE